MKLIVAPPGAGKTRTLVEQINQEITDGVSPYRILATTFSREGARELSERLGGDVTVRTVHSAALWVLRIASRARGERPPQVLPADKAALLLERAMREVDAKFIELPQAQAEIAYVRERGGAITALHPTVARIAERYFQLLREENLIDFTGILEAARRELADAELQAFLRGMHLFVDEAQDLNPLTEWPVLDGFRAVAEAFLMMASPSQQIYGFKGADWEKLVARLPEETETCALSHNYRSTPEIIEASRKLAGPDSRHMLAVRASLQAPVMVVECLDAGMEVDYIGRAINGWRTAGIPAEEIAILTRSHNLQYAIQQMLRERDIPYSLVGERPDFFQRAEIRGFGGYLELALDPDNGAALEQVINFPPVGIGVRMRYRLRGDGLLTWKHLEEALEQRDGFPQPARARMARLLAFREASAASFANGGPLPQKLERLLALTEIPDYLLGEGDSQGLHAVQELIASAVEFPTAEQFGAYLATEVRRPLAPLGIQLSTLHAAKGREWRAVILPHFQDGILPLRKMSEREEQNLAFVGLTRARDFLTITLSRPARPSPFLAGMAVEVRQWP